MTTRAQIVEEARKWLGTPFQHQGRLRGLGVDCVGLALCVARDLGIGDWSSEYPAYSSQPVGDEVLEGCRRHLREKPPGQQIRPGDVLLIRFVAVACHVAIATEMERTAGLESEPRATQLGMIHAYAGGPMRVVEHILDARWRRRIAGAFEFPGVE